MLGLADLDDALAHEPSYDAGGCSADGTECGGLRGIDGAGVLQVRGHGVASARNRSP
jgi:hypothetical protein